MVVKEIDVAAIRGQKLLGRDEGTNVLVKLEFFAREGVDEGCDELEEGPEEPGDCWGFLID